jgi:hypothetical protein
MVDLSRFLLLVALAGLTYLAGAVVLVQRRRRTEGPRTASGGGGPGWRRRAERLVLSGMLLWPLLLVWAHLEPYWPEVTRVRIVSARLQGSRPVRIVQISDLHSDPAPRLEERLPGLVRDLQPDLIVFTGDAVNSRAGLPVFRRCLRELAAVAPLYAVRGNWEQWWFREPDVYAGTGAIVLDGESRSLTIGGSRLVLAGLPVNREGETAALLGRLPEEGFRLYLHHFPAAAALAPPGSFDLALTGDTHGGQVRLPLLGALVRIPRHDVWLPSGLQQTRGGPVYVNRGIGMEGGRVPRVRFLCRPEITLIELCPAAGSRSEPAP